MIHKPPVRQPDPTHPTPRASRDWLVPLATTRQRLIIGLFALLWAVSAIRFVVWWLEPEHRVELFGFVLTSAVIGFNLMLPIWLFFTAFNARRPRADLEFGIGRVAMVVTKAPAEPWPLVRTTLEAMLDQDHRHPYDVWLADENPSDETLIWCSNKGIRVSSRYNIPSYHRPDWPRRTKSKEGNLAFFYDHWGYRDYDIVCQFDADHVPRSDYLRTVLRGFANPNVGYVAAPSVCSTGSEGSWTSRGRLHKEAPLHGLLQAGHNAGFAPTCVGSHYAVRTQALRDIGGVGPELAEDFSTSFLLAAHGWEGVFDIDVAAEGDGPMTFVDGMTQELQWARSLTTVFLRFSSGHWPNLQPTERFRFGFVQLWYPLFVGQLFIGSLLSPIAALTGRPWMSVTIVEFFSRIAVPTFVVVAFSIWIRRQTWLRPQRAPVLSWESSLFNVTRWPWNALGIVQGVLGAVRGKTYNFRVTPKGSDGHPPLPWTAVAPYALLVALQAAVGLFVNVEGRVFGYIVLTNTGAIIYTVAMVAVASLHLSENQTGEQRERLRVNGPALLLTAAAVLATLASSLRIFATAVTRWSDLRIDSQLLGLDHLVSRSTLIYVAGLVLLAGFARWDRTTSSSSEIARASTHVDPPEHRRPPQPAPPPWLVEPSTQDGALVSLSESMARQQVAGIGHLGGRHAVDLVDLNLVQTLGPNQRRERVDP